MISSAGLSVCWWGVGVRVCERDGEVEFEHWYLVFSTPALSLGQG
jgi:hypothetical protein